MKTNNRPGLLIKGAGGHFSEFVAVNKVTKDSYVRITTENSLSLECSENHPVFIDDGNVSLEAQYLEVGLDIKTIKGMSSVKTIEIIQEKTDLYDVVESENKNSYYTNGILSHNCSFVGSTGTLVDSNYLESLVFQNPINEDESGHLTVLEKYKPDHRYVAVADPSGGLGQDYSVCTIFDVTVIPYRVVAKYRNNYISPLMFPHTIVSMAEEYGTCPVLVESNNDVGGQVSYILYYELEYENTVLTSHDKKGRGANASPSGKSAPGVKTNKQVKAQGCSNLKTMIENNTLIVNDFDCIAELGTFIQKGSSYEADTDCHDDCVMTLVLFSWFVKQDFFTEYSSSNISAHLYAKHMEEMHADLAPFGFRTEDLPPETNPFLNEMKVTIDGSMASFFAN